ncbi:MAG: response regulator [Proteobacteria bacterium]|nr:response regulator [Pseudomonadota bacterium]MBU1387570.1 response regulator [Pseudomonadota bacterium]MBU1544045.1 response regulator [Pseudomonadota bacterium]MBU2431557.1 response regulator [Pseudomonadota bacterium]MBU2479787.1 response regulator [Pseudomonadota bacterium]
MDDSYQHSILVIDDNQSTREIFNNLLIEPHVKMAFSVSGEAALELIKTRDQPFSFIIAEQDIAGMKGMQCLEHIKDICPHTILCLMAAHADVDAITAVVNKGIIHHYLTKPIDPDELLDAIKLSIGKFEILMENEKLLRLAKQQNTKLYDLSCEFMETVKSHNKTILALDREIEQLQKEIQHILSQPSVNPDILSPQITAHMLLNDGNPDPEKIYDLFSETIRTLHGQFTETAHRNGFEMPRTDNGKR